MDTASKYLSVWLGGITAAGLDQQSAVMTTGIELNWINPRRVMQLKQEAQLPLRNRVSATDFFAALLLSITVTTESNISHVR